MSDHSAIEWTDATWNPTTGCTKVSPACAHCYIERTPPFRMKGRTFDRKGHIPLELHWERLDQPLRWRKGRRVFVNSLSDLFHEEVTDEFIADVFAVMALARWHTFQVLTKRPGRMRVLLNDNGFREAVAEFITVILEDCDVPASLRWDALDRRKDDARATAPDVEGDDWPLPNVWVGCSVENQHFADERIPLLLQTPAAVRFISAEPLLGPLNLREMAHQDDWHVDALDTPDPSCRLHWVIAGGESGPKARPSPPDWFRSIRDQCQAAGVAFFFKQWGEWAPYDRGGVNSAALVNPGALDTPMQRFGKKAAGRLLDGRTWDEFPMPAPEPRG